MNSFDKFEIEKIVQKSLDHAEHVWGEHGAELRESVMAKGMALDSAMQVSTKIPRHELIEPNQEKVSTFIALVADIRNSSQHLLCAISEKEAKVSELQRVYYETSALLPALERTIQYEEGSVTEYLGDGLLALFFVDDDEKASAIYAAYRAAKNCINETLSIVNEELHSRYRLPPLQIGIGLGMSPALISLVGLPNDAHPKAIGRCVYNATKLSSGKNEIHVDVNLEREWPTTKNGTLRFSAIKMKNVTGYLVHKKSQG